ncbi:MAG: hypothetical protein NTX79_07160 [Candidatus Micrarchaeota archaeon]|nr:hypothetical protein [Candidatus Micrarchaeota archaeon]
MSKNSFKKALILHKYDYYNQPGAQPKQPLKKAAETPYIPALSVPSRNIKEIIEQSASKEEGTWEKAKDAWCKAYLANQVSEADVNALLSRLPGKHLRIGSFVPTEQAMRDALKDLNDKGLASIAVDAFYFSEFMMFGKRSYHLKSSDLTEFYWAVNEGETYGVYPPDSKTDYELVLRTIYLLGHPIRCKLHKSDLNALDQKIASALVDVLVYISQTGGGEKLFLKEHATAKEMNSHLKYKSKRQITGFFTEDRFEHLIPKHILDYAERMEED